MTPGFLRSARYPHPVMCGRMGRIDAFPDHPHEGECGVPPDLTQSFGGAEEYPTDGSGTQIVPEVVAWGRVRAGNTTRPTGPAPWERKERDGDGPKTPDVKRPDTKGILERLNAVERLLEKWPAWIGRFVFVQVAAPTSRGTDPRTSMIVATATVSPASVSTVRLS